LYYLSNLKDLKLYNNIEVLGIQKNKNQRLDTAIINVGNTDNDVVQLINSGLFKRSLYLGYYVPKNIESTNKRKRTLINQKDVYKDISTKTNGSVKYFRNTLSAYRGLNVYYDLFKEFELNETTIRTKSLERIDTFLNFLNLKIEEVNKNYKDIVLVFNVDDSKSDMDEYFSFKNSKTPVTYLYNAIKRNVLLNNLITEKKVQVVIYTNNNNTFFKFPLDTNTLEKRKIQILNRMENLLNISFDKEVPEEDKPSDGKIELERNTDDDRIVEVNDKANKVVDFIKDTFNIPPNSLGLNDTEIDLVNKISDVVEKDIDEKKLENNTEEQILSQLDNNLEFKSYMNDLKDIKKTGRRKKITEDELRKKQDEVNIEALSVKDIINDYKASSIDVKKLDVDVLNDEIKVSTLKDFDDSYINKQFNKDLVSVITAFNNDSDVKMFVTDVKKENTSTDLTKKMTYTVTLQDEFKTKHTFKIDLPIIKEGRFMQVNGGKKLIMKQIMLKPIVKTKPDTVQITTNYNKFFITRFGTRKSNKLNYLSKMMNLDLKGNVKDGNTLNYKNGNSLTINSSYNVTMEYNDISSYLLNLQVNDLNLIFDQSEVQELLNPNNPKSIKALTDIEYDKERFMIAGYTKKPFRLVGIDYISKEVFLIDKRAEEEASGSFTSFVIDNLFPALDESIYDDLSKIKNTNSLSYTRVEINNKTVPLVLLLGYENGLMDTLDRYGVKYDFSEKNKKVSVQDDKGKIKFKDGYLYYDSSRIRNSLLLSGLNVMNTSQYNIADLESKEPYLDVFYNLYGSRNAGKGFHNTLSLMVDPITLDVLKSLKLPENIYDILLYSNTLLEDLSFTKLNDMTSYRIRGAEQVNGMLYKIFADSFKTYKDTLNAGNPIRVSVPQDILLKRLLESPIVDEYSVLNPSLEIEKMGGATYKGLSGTNSDQAYTKEIRSYDPSMKGILGINSPDSNKVGVVRQLTYNPSLLNTRGFLDLDKNHNPNTDIYTPAELLSPFTSKHADPPRIGMQVTQQKHVIPVAKQNKLLFGSGVEKTIPYILGDDFVAKAKKDGMVESIDEKNHIAILKYNDGTKDIVDISRQLAKNGNGGLDTVHVKPL